MIEDQVTVKHLSIDTENLDKYDNISEPLTKEDKIICDTTYTSETNNASPVKNPLLLRNQTVNVLNSGYFKGDLEYISAAQPIDIDKTDVICENCLFNSLKQKNITENQILIDNIGWRVRNINIKLINHIKDNMVEYVPGLDFTNFTQNDIDTLKQNLNVIKPYTTTTLNESNLFNRTERIDGNKDIDRQINKYRPNEVTKSMFDEFFTQPYLQQSDIPYWDSEDRAEYRSESGYTYTPPGIMPPVRTYNSVINTWKNLFGTIEYRSYLDNTDRKIFFNDIKNSFSNQNKTYQIEGENSTVSFEFDDASLLADGRKKYDKYEYEKVPVQSVELVFKFPEDKINTTLVPLRNLPPILRDQYINIPNGEFKHLVKSGTHKDTFTYCGYPSSILGASSSIVNPDYLSGPQEDRIFNQNVCPKCKEFYDGEIEDIPYGYFD